jgi:hypothetical protein
MASSILSKQGRKEANQSFSELIKIKNTYLRVLSFLL